MVYDRTVVPYERQRDLVVCSMVAIVVLFGCLFYFALPLTISSTLATVVFVAGLVVGRRIANVLDAFFPGLFGANGRLTRFELD